MKQVHQRELMNARVATVAALVRNRNQSFARREGCHLFPQWRERDAVDAVTPGIPRRELWLVQPIQQLQLVQFTTRKPPKFLQLRFDLTDDVGRQYARQVFAQKGIALVLIIKARRRLGE